VKLVYVDESFDRVEYWVTGLVVPSERAVELESTLDAIVVNAAESFPITPTAELHAHALTQGSEDWASMASMLRARLGIYEACLQAIHDTAGVRAFIYGLDRAKHRNKYTTPFPERQVLLGHVAQRVNGICTRDCPLLLIADDSESKQQIREHITRFRRQGTLSRINPRPLRNIADTVYFAPSRNSRLIQAADLVSYIHFRKRRNAGADPRAVAAATRLWATISGMCDTNMWEQ